MTVEILLQAEWNEPDDIAPHGPRAAEEML